MPANGSQNFIPGISAKRIGQYSLDGAMIKVYNSITEAGRLTGVCTSSIGCVANGRPMHNTAGGFIWKHC